MVFVGPWRQGSSHPPGHRVRFSEAPESLDQSGKARPSKAAKATVLEPANDGLIDTAKPLELALRQADPLPSANHHLADQPEPTPGLLIGTGQSERLPSHDITMMAGPYRAISRSPWREGSRR